MKTLTVQFLNNSNKEYHYTYGGKEPVKAGQYVVVDSPHQGYALALVYHVEDGVTASATKSIVAVVDDAAYKARKEALAERAKIVSRLKVKEAKKLESERFAHLAASDAEAAEMVRRLQEIDAIV